MKGLLRSLAVRLAVFVIVITALLLLFPPSSRLQNETFDVLISGGRVVDGTGAPWFRADIGIRGDRIAAVGNLRNAEAARRIDASNLVVAPGFIDLLGQSEFYLLVDNRAASKIMQGVTTEVSGEGTTIAPINDRMVEDLRPSLEHYKVTVGWRTLGEYFDHLEKRVHPAINVALFVGVGGVREYVMGKDSRRPTRDELKRMKELLARSMEEGALGVSSSLQYPPDRYFTTDELIELASVAARYGGLYMTHQRSEGNQIFESLEEVFTIAEKAGVPAEIWHLKVAYKSNWGRMPEVLSRIEQARARGLDITANQYPYDRASNSLHSCLPLWVREGGVAKMIPRLRDPDVRERIKREMEDPTVTAWENQWYGSGGGDGVMVSSVLSPELRKYEGKTLTEIGREMGKDPRDALMDLVLADRGGTSCVISVMQEEDVRTCLKHPFVSIDTDSAARAEDGPLSVSKSHPRAWGTFARILGKYVREEKLMRLEEAIRKMTSQPATRVGLRDRGIIRPGMAADITIFDPDTIRDVATFEDPNHYSVGVHYVLVNGKTVVEQGRITSERPGRALLGPGYGMTP
ncbi:MAG TPA: D-aminoacylase [Acidobacteriota bacterium]|nr:D-aminoacylase [Acidobacteriota bacterium]